MKETKKKFYVEAPPWMDWSRKDSEDLVKLYLLDYFQTLDDYYLGEALQIAREDGVDFEKMMRQVRFLQA